MRNMITTPRLTLRRMTAHDVTRLVELCGDIRVAANLSRMPHPYSVSDAQQWLERQEVMWTTTRDRVWGIELRSNGLIGGIGLHREARMSVSGTETWEMGYWLGFPFWGQGYATEAGIAVLNELDETLGPQEVTAGHALKNPNSGHVLTKLGFHKVDLIKELSVLATGELSSSQVMLRPAPVLKLDPERSTPP